MNGHNNAKKWFNTQHLILVFKTIDPFLLLVHEVGPPKSV